MKLTEWGVPDWKDATAYGDVSSWTFDRWRWEFCRRCPDIRTEFDKLLVDPSCPFFLVGDEQPFYEPDKHDSEMSGFALPSPLAYERYGYFLLPNPRIDEQPEQAIRPVIALDKALLVDPGSQWVAQVRDYFNATGVELDDIQTTFLDLALRDCYAVNLKTHQVAIKFDLDQPLEPQVKVARDVLRDLQTTRHGQRLQRRSHPEKWLGYLRVLDARDVDETWSEIVNRHAILTPYRRPKMTPLFCAGVAGPMRCSHHTAQPRRASGAWVTPWS